MVAIIITSLFLLQADFPVCTATYSQSYPCAVYANNLYYVFWSEDSTPFSINGARIAADGTVLDPDGKVLFSSHTWYEPQAAFDGTNLLVVFRDSC